MKEGTINYEQV